MARSLVAVGVLAWLLASCDGIGGSPQPITISVELGQAQPLVELVELTVLDGAGNIVAQTRFEPGWIEPEGGFRCGAGEAGIESGADTEREIKLPAADTYIFDVSEVVVGTPCTLNMSGYVGGKHERAVDDGDRLRLPIGELAWIS